MSNNQRTTAARLIHLLRRFSPVAVLRRHVAAAVHQRLVGPDPAAVYAGIWGTSGERWFCPEDAVWDVHDDPALYVGGLRSLMLQTLHPLAMAGVAGHSGYRSDPWGRLQRTGSYVAHTTYAPISTATAMIERLVQVHEGIRGEAPDGRSYRADDPNLLLWVHVCEIDSFLRAHVAFGRRTLTPAEQDDYVRQTAIPARLLGVKDAPESVAELRATLRRYLPELTSSPQALDTIEFLVSQPPVPTPGKPAYWLLAAGAISTLPRSVRHELELPDHPLLDRWLWHPATGALVRLMRWVTEDPSIAKFKSVQPAS